MAATAETKRRTEKNCIVTTRGRIEDKAGVSVKTTSSLRRRTRLWNPWVKGRDGLNLYTPKAERELMAILAS